tara:strand:- start:1895 stop:2794 length:900 start_codon:yes stop_codon:yes gene_type:complete
MALQNLTDDQYYEGPDGVWNSADEDYGAYQFTSLKDIINNFIIAYVGEGKIISKIKRLDVAFHAQRAIQELSFDTFPSVKSQEIEVPPTLYMVLPPDYVNYVKVCWVDDSGIERILYPAIKTGDPKAVLQDDSYEYAFDQTGEIIYAEDSEMWKKFKDSQDSNQDSSKHRDRLLNHSFGRRYGLDPQHAQTNGNFFIDQYKGLIRFSSNVVNKLVVLKYISDGLAKAEDMVVHKFAEEAMYKYIAHAILATRANTQEYLVARFKREASVAKRNAKLRLSNIKLEEITQILRGKSKQIKH